MKLSSLTLFAVMCLVQLAVPFSMIFQHEQVLKKGAVYKFRCGPVDPYDAFRGRFVTLTFPDTTVEHWRGAPLSGTGPVYVQLGTDDAGFAKITGVTQSPPESGDYLKASATTGGIEDVTLWVSLPFNRYYMDEFQAPAAEIAYRQESRTEEGAYASVRVKDGIGVVAGLFLGDLSIEVYLHQRAAGSDSTP